MGAVWPPVVIFLFATVFSSASLSFQRQAVPFELNGTVAQAEVIGRRVVRVLEDEKWITKYFVTFRYDASGQVYTVEEAVRVGSYDDLSESSNHEIRFLKDDPSRFEVHVGQKRKFANWVGWIGLAFWSALPITLLWTSMRARRALLARDYGDIEKARVEGVGSDSDSYWLRWREPSGAFNNSMSSSSLQRYEAYPIGTEIEVYRDSRGKTWWVGDIGPRKASANVPSVAKR